LFNVIECFGGIDAALTFKLSADSL